MAVILGPSYAGRLTGWRRRKIFILFALLLGVLIGWIASLLFRTPTSEGILIDIAAGLLGALPMASLLGYNSAFDSLVAGGLGAVIATAILQWVRRRLSGG